MLERHLIMSHAAGLHARPASLFVQKAKSFQSAITLHTENKQGDAKSILSVLGLGIRQDTPFTLRADGEDEALAIKALTELIESNFGEA